MRRPGMEKLMDNGGVGVKLKMHLTFDSYKFM
jgi:hypothetical protein